MTSKTRSYRPSPALVISCVAIFLALTGSALAVSVGKNSIRSKHIANGTVRTVDLRANAVKTAKIAPDAVRAQDIAEGAVGSPEVLDESLTNQDLGDASVTSSEVADQSLTADDLGPDSVGASEIAVNAVGAGEIAVNAVGAGEIAANSVGSAELQTSSVRASDLGPISQVSKSTTIKANGNASVGVTCPAGTTVISGGGSSGFYQVHLASSYRAGNGWHIDARSSANSDTTIVAYAYCLAA